MAPSSSAKKVAKLASRGKGRKVRFQGGTVFPAIIAVVVIVMIGLVVYARASRPTDGSGAPRLGDHWHAAYGFYVCDATDDSARFLPALTGTKEDQSIDPATGNNVYTDKHFRLYGIHSHGDGVIHYHPYGSRATGSRARLGVFLDAYNVKLTDTQLDFPADQQDPADATFDTKDYKCNGQDAQIRVRVWNSFAKPGEYVDYVTDFKNIRIDRNGMAFTIAIVPKGKDIPQPPSAPKLPELGTVDGGDAITVPAAAGSGVTTGTGSTPVSAVTGSTPSGSTPVSGTSPSASTAVVADTGVATSEAAATTSAASATTGG